MNPINNRTMKKNPKPSSVIVNLVERSINGYDVFEKARAKEELLKRIGNMERNNSKFFEYYNAMESILCAVKETPNGHSLSYHSSPRSICSVVWELSIKVKYNLKDQKEETFCHNPKYDIELAKDIAGFAKEAFNSSVEEVRVASERLDNKCSNI